jgi:hypothetical protein
MKRFSLKFLFAVITLLIVFLGYSQWRRQRLLSEAQALKEQGMIVQLPDQWIDRLWQRVPAKANLLPYQKQETILRERAKAMGVKEFKYGIWIP